MPRKTMDRNLEEIAEKLRFDYSFFLFLYSLFKEAYVTERE